VPQQWAQAGLVPMEGVERMNMVITWPQQRIGFVQRNPYTMNMDRREGRNCYYYGEFRHIARHYRNRGVGNRIGKGRRLEYENREQNLNRKRDLISLG